MVYLTVERKKDPEFIKIGYTSKPTYHERYKSGSTDCPLVHISLLSLEGDEKLEKKLQDKFRKYQKQDAGGREWFEFSDEIKSFIDSQNNKGLNIEHKNENSSKDYSELDIIKLIFNNENRLKSEIDKVYKLVLKKSDNNLNGIATFWKIFTDNFMFNSLSTLTEDMFYIDFEFNGISGRKHCNLIFTNKYKLSNKIYFKFKSDKWENGHPTEFKVKSLSFVKDYFLKDHFNFTPEKEKERSEYIRNECKKESMNIKNTWVLYLGYSDGTENNLLNFSSFMINGEMITNCKTTINDPKSFKGEIMIRKKSIKDLIDSTIYNIEYLSNKYEIPEDSYEEEIEKLKGEESIEDLFLYK